MSATRFLAALCALMPLQGCVTETLWDGWSDHAHDAPSMSLPPRQAAPQELVEAVRTGDGSHHLLVRMSNGGESRYVIDAAAPAPDAAAIGSHQWPTTDAAALPRPREINHGPMPAGLPIAVTPGQPPRAPRPWSQAQPRTPDPVMAALLDAPPDATPDDPVVGLDGRRVVVTDVEGQVTVLAEFSPPNAPRPHPTARKRRHLATLVETSARVVTTPFALALDVVAGAGIVAGGMLLLPVMFFAAPRLFR